MQEWVQAQKGRKPRIWSYSGAQEGSCVRAEFLTLSPAAADFAKQSAMTQTVQSLLPDQLQQLWLQTLFQLAAQMDTHTHSNLSKPPCLKGMVWQRNSFKFINKDMFGVRRSLLLFCTGDYK